VAARATIRQLADWPYMPWLDATPALHPAFFWYNRAVVDGAAFLGKHQRGDA